MSKKDKAKNPTLEVAGKDKKVVKASKEQLETLVAKKKAETPKEEAKADKVSKKALKVIAASKRETSYIYPADCVDAAAKKKFRTKARATIARYEKEIKLISNSKKEGDLKAISKEYSTWKAANLANAEK